MARINQAMQAPHYSGGHVGGDAENMRVPKVAVSNNSDFVQPEPVSGNEPTHADQLAFCQGRIHALEKGLVDAHQQISFMRDRLGI